MLLRSERITIRCRGSTDAVAEALRAASAEWRESKLGAAGRGIGILGWKVRVRDARIVVRPRIGGVRASGFIPHFVGQVSITGTGPVLVGELRLSWHARTFMLVWLSGVGGVPLFALFGPPAMPLGEHILQAFFFLFPAAAMFSFGLWMTKRSWTVPAAVLKAFLTRACDRPPVVTLNPLRDED
jgi:hypothetical protein